MGKIVLKIIPRCCLFLFIPFFAIINAADSAELSEIKTGMCEKVNKMLSLGMLPLDYEVISTPVAFYALGCSVCDLLNGSFQKVLGDGASAFGYEAEMYDQQANRLLTRSKAYAVAGTCILLEPMINKYTGIPTRFGLAFFAYAAST